jgi:hypothetical protein
MRCIRHTKQNKGYEVNGAILQKKPIFLGKKLSLARGPGLSPLCFGPPANLGGQGLGTDLAVQKIFSQP